MKKLIAMSTLMLAMIIAGSANAAYTETVDVYQVLDSRGATTTANWQHTYDGSADPISWATLTIVAEGVDDGSTVPGGEQDGVWFAGHFLGYLDQQNFYNTSYDINPGPGALGAPRTALTTTVFNLDTSWITPIMNASVQVDLSSWIMEVETSTLTVVSVPAPGALLLGSMGISLVSWLRRRKTL